MITFKYYYLDTQISSIVTRKDASIYCRVNKFLRNRKGRCINKVVYRTLSALAQDDFELVEKGQISPDKASLRKALDSYIIQGLNV